jgi:hypothetical protein
MSEWFDGHCRHNARGRNRGRLSLPEETLESSYRMEVRTLDSFKFQRVVFIKIDVEGHEESGLDGAWDTVKKCKPTLLIEIEDRHNPGGLERISKKLSTLGYSGTYFYERKQHDLAAFNARLHQDVSRIESSPRRYVNNFIFRV